MASITDEQNYSQGFKPCSALTERTRRRVRYIVSATGMASGTKALEIGCGDGDMLHEVVLTSGASVLGIDRSPKFITQAQACFGQHNFEIMDFWHAESLARYEGYFDCIYGNGILHHLMPVPDLVKGLRQIRRFLKPNGRICFIEPNLFNPYVYLIFSYAPLRRLAKLEPHEMAFTHRTIVPALEECGFHNIVVKYKDFLLPNTPSVLIKPVTMLGDDILEHTPIRFIAQSLFISASI